MFTNDQSDYDIEVTKECECVRMDERGCMWEREDECGPSSDWEPATTTPTPTVSEAPEP